jgi:hypothetical protein
LGNYLSEYYGSAVLEEGNSDSVCIPTLEHVTGKREPQNIEQGTAEY